MSYLLKSAEKVYFGLCICMYMNVKKKERDRDREKRISFETLTMLSFPAHKSARPPAKFK